MQKRCLGFPHQDERGAEDHGEAEHQRGVTLPCHAPVAIWLSDRPRRASGATRAEPVRLQSVAKRARRGARNSEATASSRPI